MQNFEPFQKVIVRNMEGSVWSCDLYSHKELSTERLHFVLSGSTYTDEDILPYAGNEHLLGTTDSPMPKWEPKPGELVAVSDTGEEDDWEPCIYKGESGDPEMPFRAARLTPRNRRSYTWIFCEPLRKHFTIPNDA